jgi:mRNA interferase RelE/StbE
MAEYKIYFRESIAKDFRVIPKKEANRILQRIKLFTTEPRPIGYEKLTDQERYRVRQGRYCIVYSIQDAEHSVWIVKVSHRKDVYRKS